jgi:hypothetical protein
VLSDFETDIELLILGPDSSFFIEVYVVGDQIYELSQDRENVSNITLYLKKDHGVSHIGDVRIALRNDTHRYTSDHANSIFYGYQDIRCPLRIRCGWGDKWKNGVATRFQGQIKYIAGNHERRSQIIAYCALKILAEYSVVGTNGLTIDETVVPGMNPLDIIDYIINDYAQLQVWDMDSSIYVDALDPSELTPFMDYTAHYHLASTTFDQGTKLLKIIEDLLKIIGGFLYSGTDAKIHYTQLTIDSFYNALATDFEGDETAQTKQIFAMKKYQDESALINQINWTYGSANNKVSYENSSSVSTYGPGSKDFTIKWNLVLNSPLDLELASGRLFGMYALPFHLYKFTMSWIMGTGLDVDLGDIIKVSDPATNDDEHHVLVTKQALSLMQQNTVMEGESASKLEAKYFLFSSENDEGDGKGITGANFAVNWKLRFLFFGHASDQANPGFDLSGNVNGSIDPAFGDQDVYGNGIEENFVFWG